MLLLLLLLLLLLNDSKLVFDKVVILSLSIKVDL